MIINPIKRLATALAAALAALATASLADAQPVNAGHLTAELVADHAAVAPGQTIHVALRQSINDGWHTYWRNAGDSGLPTTLNWSLPAGWRVGEMVWPTPKPLPIGPLMDYGYEGEVLTPIPLSVPADAKPGQTVTLKAHMAALACKTVCTPQDVDLTLTLPVVATASAADPVWGAKIAAALADAPKAGLIKATFTRAAGALKLSLAGAPLKAAAPTTAYFFPYDGGVIDPPKPQGVDLGPSGLTLTLAPGSAFAGPTIPTHLTGVLSLGDKAYEIDATPGPPLPGAAGLGPPHPPRSFADAARALGGALAFAFIGGLILNLMPCVFPVLSMKAASLAARAHYERGAWAEGLAFMAGVVATFLILAGMVIAARAAGEAVGWGFQLQSPGVVAALMLVMLAVGLNLSGLFEVGAGVQALAGSAPGADHGGLIGAAFTGVLAVAVAAPCTAPFMAPAIGFALTQGPLAALAVFLALGLGLAAPFTALSFSPSLLRALPRPGAWMEGLRKVLAFPMYAAAAWLLWVASQQIGPLGLAGLLAGLVFAAFAAWVHGVAQRKRLSGGAAPLSRLIALTAAGLAIAATIWAILDGGPPVRAGTSNAPASAAEIPAEPYSPQRLAALLAQGKPVFVNFTAAWCVTCQVNDRAALSGEAVVAAFKNAGVVYMVGDWTNRDDVIAKALAEHGRAGVPLYLVYGTKGGEPQVLPQILTPGIVQAALKKAR